MRVDCIDDKIIVYLKGINYVDLDELGNLVIKYLEKYYGIFLKGFYEVKAFVDKKYGVVLEFLLEDLDIYIDFSKVDLHMIERNTTFLYKLEDIFDMNIKKFYLYKGNYYITMDNVNNNNIEFGSIVYKNCDEILENGELIVL